MYLPPVSQRTISISVHALGARADSGLSHAGDAEARLALVEILTREAWSLSGLEIPNYPRASAPVLLRPLRAGSV